MKTDSDLRVMIREGRILTLKEMYEEHEKTHVEQANLSYEEKIRALVDMQRLAFSWGKKSDVIVWKM